MQSIKPRTTGTPFQSSPPLSQGQANGRPTPAVRLTLTITANVPRGAARQSTIVPRRPALVQSAPVGRTLIRNTVHEEGTSHGQEVAAGSRSGCALERR